MSPKGTRYEICRATEVDGKLIAAKCAGYAYLNEGSDFYLVKLFLLPHNTYYLSKNRHTPSGYTVFSKSFDLRGVRRFQNPVGTGQLRDQLKTHLRLIFPDLASSMFMSLFPTETQGAKEC